MNDGSYCTFVIIFWGFSPSFPEVFWGGSSKFAFAFSCHQVLNFSDRPSGLKKPLSLVSAKIRKRKTIHNNCSFLKVKCRQFAVKKQAISEVTTENYGQVWVVEESATCFALSFVSGFFTTVSGRKSLGGSFKPFPGCRGFLHVSSGRAESDCCVFWSAPFFVSVRPPILLEKTALS